MGVCLSVMCMCMVKKLEKADCRSFSQHIIRDQDSKIPTSAIIVVHSACNMCFEVACKQMMWAEFFHQRTVIISL